MSEMILRKDVPSLDAYEVESVDLNDEYWTPIEEGEVRRMFFMGVRLRSVPAHNDGDTEVELPCAVFIQPSKDGEPRTVTNASKRLVAAFENNGIESGTP